MEQHPDIFTAIQAAAYLGIDTATCDGWQSSLEHLRAEYGLPCRKLGGTTMYHRRDLDAVVDAMFGRDLNAKRRRVV